MVGSKIVQMGAVSREAVRVAMESALADAGIAQADIVRTISTGYGRKLVPSPTRPSPRSPATRAAPRRCARACGW